MVWSRDELAARLGVPASRVDAKTCMVSVMNGDPKINGSAPCVWIDGNGRLKVLTDNDGMYRFEIYVIFIDL